MKDKIIPIIQGITLSVIVGFGGLIFHSMRKPDKGIKGQATLIYEGPVYRADINDFTKKLLKIKNAKDSFKDKSNVSVDIEIVASHNSLYDCYVRLKEENGRGIESALKHYFSNAGLPSIIGTGSDWEACNTILNEHDKTLRKQFYRGGLGKHVINL